MMKSTLISSASEPEWPDEDDSQCCPCFWTRLDLTTYLHRPVALPTLGGLFVGFIISAGDESGDSYFQIAVRSFYGQHELDEDLQKLHTRLVDDCEKPIAAHENYGWDRLWQGQRSSLLEAICRS